MNCAILRDKQGLGLKKLRSLVEMFAIAVKDAA